MEQSTENRKLLAAKYKAQVEPLLRYIPWLQDKAGSQVSSNYTGNGIDEHTITFPVYDSTLLSLIKEIQKTSLLDRNYVYVYSRNRIRTVEDEKALIEKSTIVDFHNLTGVLSKYILGGMTKSVLWSQAVTEGVLLQVLLKMKDVLEFWDQPLA